jgi:hypothetical protein
MDRAEEPKENGAGDVEHGNSDTKHGPHRFGGHGPHRFGGHGPHHFGGMRHRFHRHRRIACAIGATAVVALIVVAVVVARRRRARRAASAAEAAVGTAAPAKQVWEGEHPEKVPLGADVVESEVVA